MKHFEKILELHHLLSKSKHPLELRFLLERLDCSESTFHRVRTYMIKTLGAPLYFDHRYHGYRYDESSARFELPGLWLSPNETEALLNFHEAIDTLQKGLFTELFSPIKQQLSRFTEMQHLTPNASPIRIIPHHTRPVDDARFRTCADAVIRKHTLAIRHNKPGDETVERIISPFAIIRYRDNWYLDAFCHLRNGLRSFSLDRISFAEHSSVTFHDVPVETRNEFFADAYGIFNGPATHIAQIRFSSPAAEIVSREEWHPKQKGAWTPDLHFDLEIPYGDDRELVMDILKWGTLAEVIGPEELRMKIRNILAESLKKYES